MALLRSGKAFAAVVWPVVAVIAVALAAVSRSRCERRLSLRASGFDTLVAALTRDQVAFQSQLATGDSLPDVTLVDRNGRSVSLRERARGGARYAYFYKRECKACQVLVPFWAAAPASRTGELIRVRIVLSGNAVADSGTGSYAWRADGLPQSRRLAGGVPALLVVDRTATVLAAAYGARQVSKMSGFYGLLDAAAVEAAVRGQVATLTTSVTKEVELGTHP